MRGEFNLQVRDAKGLRDEDFSAAAARGELEALLESLGLEQAVHVRNKLTDHIVWGMYSFIFGHGLPKTDPWNGTPSILNCVCLMTDADEITYEEGVNYWYRTMHNWTNSANTSTGGKLFSYRTGSPVIDTDANGKEEVWVRHRWLWLPSEGNSNNIRSLAIFGAHDYTSSTANRVQLGRVLLKDPDTGGPIVVIKNINQVLTLEYTFSMLSI